ncbi:MAG: HD domain-containing protein [Firmicutes bacterium]|jgi:metal-dependent HD superfamily phosphatase/phosphodiesterase|nr:HD domain-containing protein [Bacillota bacterium]
MITLKDIQANPTFQTLIRRSNEYLSMLGYTEHGQRHVSYVSTMTAYILRTLGYDERLIELGSIAGYLHDIGNMHNRKYHGPTGANIVYFELRRMGMPLEEICEITTSIANHEEEIGIPVNPISAALVIADKSDAHRARVGRKTYSVHDIHDRVNHAITGSSLIVDKDELIITLKLVFDTTECQIMDYFTIYLTRMEMCQQAATLLGCTFRLVINDLELIGGSVCTADTDLRPASGEGRTM